MRTYVIGYDTAGSNFAGLLDQMAVAGETGDTAHRSVTSGDQLLDEFRKITAGAVSCSFVLGQGTDFRKVNVYLDGQRAEHSVDWVLRPDGSTVDLIGEACNSLQQGAALEAEVVCEVINII